MILRIIGLLILVIGASCLLAFASWQYVLLGFGMAGIGYGVIRLRQSAIRRRRMRRLWTNAKEIDLFESFYSEQSELNDILSPNFTLPSKEDRDKIMFPHRRKTLPQAPAPRQSHYPQGQKTGRMQSRGTRQTPQKQYSARNDNYGQQPQMASRADMDQNSNRRKNFNMKALARSK
ncbi:MAG: hypothetical protein SFY67_13010 [Candidatus Melainabacteria bacterium]|nr:hypothetical protein [Candidatus Melainabacteria bacterium]